MSVSYVELLSLLIVITFEGLFSLSNYRVSINSRNNKGIYTMLFHFFELFTCAFLIGLELTRGDEGMN